MRVNKNNTMKRLVPFFLLLLFLTQSACRPRIISISPTSGPAGTLVHVTGLDLFGAIVKWDAGSPAETTIPGSFMGASFFSVPPNATPGAHAVRLSDGDAYTSAAVTFTVTQGVVRPAPRVDDITCRDFHINSAGQASFILMVHGANIDAGAQIAINNVPQSSFLWQALDNSATMALYDATTLGYPTYHFATVICAVNNVAPGTVLENITVTNLGNEHSINAKNYTVAASMDLLDSDGDGLRDVWETNGADVDSNGTVDVDLPGLGANRYRKDIFLEVDWMETCAPEREIWPIANASFEAAPVLNCDGSAGITLHIDHGQLGNKGGGGDILPHVAGIHFGELERCPFSIESGLSCINFHALKRRHFDSSRLTIFRYCIFGDANANGLGTGGKAEDEFSNDFFVTTHLNENITMDDFIHFQASTFVHELGHTLGFHHGGEDQVRRKPNYNSVMNPNFGYLGSDIDCNPFTYEFGHPTYSLGMRRDLDEACLNEGDGICNHVAADWNMDGTATGTCIRRSLSEDTAISVLHDYFDWSFIKYDFTAPGSFWAGN
jgi:hypothetical protein